MIAIQKQALNKIIADPRAKKSWFRLFSKEHPVFASLKALIASEASDYIDIDKVLSCFIKNPLKPTRPESFFYVNMSESYHGYIDIDLIPGLKKKDAASCAFFVLSSILYEIRSTSMQDLESHNYAVTASLSKSVVFLTCFFSLNKPLFSNLLRDDSFKLSNYLISCIRIIGNLFGHNSMEVSEPKDLSPWLKRPMNVLTKACSTIVNQPLEKELIELGVMLKTDTYFEQSAEFFQALRSQADLKDIIGAVNKALNAGVSKKEVLSLLKRSPSDLIAEIKFLEEESRRQTAFNTLKIMYSPHKDPFLLLNLINFYNEFSVSSKDKILQHKNPAQLNAIRPQLTKLKQSLYVSKDAMLKIVNFALSDNYPADTLNYFMKFVQQVEQLRADGAKTAEIGLAEVTAIHNIIDSVGSALAEQVIDQYLKVWSGKFSAVIPNSAMNLTQTQRFFDNRPLLPVRQFNAVHDEITNHDNPDVILGLA